MNGISISYLLQNDTWIVVLLLLSTFLAGYMFLYYIWSLCEEFVNLFMPHKRKAVDRFATANMRYFLLIEFLVALFAALLFVIYQHREEAVSQSSDYFIIRHILVYSVVVFVALLLRNALYWLIVRVFFSTLVRRVWFQSLLFTDLILFFYFLVVAWVVVYLNATASVSWALILSFALVPKLVLLLQGMRLIALMKETSTRGYIRFLKGLVRQLYFIPYLCALEMIPLAIIALYWFHLNDFLLTK